MVGTATLVILLGLFAAIIPFVGPLFGFGMGPEPAWAVTTSRIVRHVVPAIAIVAGGVMLLPRLGLSRIVGGVVVAVGAVWLTIAPVVLGRVTESVPPLIDILRPVTYHYGVGVVLAILAGVAIGRASHDPEEVTVRESRRERAGARLPQEARN